MENAKAFIGAGGSATWQFIVFPWNKHQVDEVRELANEMGFEIVIIRNNRDSFLDNLNFSFIASITKNPTLCRLFELSGFGFPKPTKSSMIDSLSCVIFF